MLKQSSSRIKKVMFSLLVVLLVTSVTAVAQNTINSTNVSSAMTTMAQNTTNSTTVSSNDKIVDVSMKNGAYNPKAVEISVGDTVKWTNMDSIDHGVEGSIFKSGIMSPGQSYEFKFITPGVYNYKCPLHPAEMTGTITVVAK